MQSQYPNRASVVDVEPVNTKKKLFSVAKWQKRAYGNELN
jgi:hypothetical protein